MTHDSDRGGPYGRRVDLDAARRTLPPAYLTALQRALGGAEEDELAALMDVPVEAVPPLLRVAVAKLATALADQAGRAAISAQRGLAAEPLAIDDQEEER